MARPNTGLPRSRFAIAFSRDAPYFLVEVGNVIPILDCPEGIEFAFGLQFGLQRGNTASVLQDGIIRQIKEWIRFSRPGQLFPFWK